MIIRLTADEIKKAQELLAANPNWSSVLIDVPAQNHGNTKREPSLNAAQSGLLDSTSVAGIT